MDFGKLSLDNTLGAMYLGRFRGVATLMHLGLMNDAMSSSGRHRRMILCLWIIDTVHAALITRSMYSYLVTDFSDILAIVRPTWTFSVVETGTLRLQLAHPIHEWQQAASVLGTFGRERVSKDLTQSCKANHILGQHWGIEQHLRLGVHGHSEDFAHHALCGIFTVHSHIPLSEKEDTDPYTGKADLREVVIDIGFIATAEESTSSGSKLGIQHDNEAATFEHHDFGGSTSSQ
ncbi:hypothetical protein FKP32DRAFT_1600768 [Trametes sanguinea]|nr:hypothetical protein FKP32DRAFT_1600768 [Trametes sanguinea]